MWCLLECRWVLESGNFAVISLRGGGVASWGAFRQVGGFKIFDFYLYCICIARKVYMLCFQVLAQMSIQSLAFQLILVKSRDPIQSQLLAPARKVD